MTYRKTPDELLEEAISAGDLPGVKRAVEQGADVIRINADKSTVIPLFAAYQNLEILDYIVKTIIEQSQAIKGSVVNKKEAIHKNLLNRSDYARSTPPFLDHIIRNKTPERLAIVWNNLKGTMDINEPLHMDGEPLIYKAVSSPVALAYLLSERADINKCSWHGDTPIMRMFRLSFLPNDSEVDELLALCEKNNVDVHAVDDQKRGLAFHALYRNGAMSPNKKCVDWALKNGVDFLARDKDGKTATDYLMAAGGKSLDDIYETLFSKLTAYGYSLAALTKRYADEPMVIDLNDIFKRKKTNEVCQQLAQPDLAARLWNPDGSPSTLLLSAFGHDVPEKIFEHPSLRDDPAAKKALYEKMKEKLPPQCQEILRTGIDLSFLRDADSPRRPAAVDEALKRKSAFGERLSGERQPGK